MPAAPRRRRRERPRPGGGGAGSPWNRVCLSSRHPFRDLVGPSRFPGGFTLSDSTRRGKCCQEASSCGVLRLVGCCASCGCNRSGVRSHHGTKGREGGGQRRSVKDCKRRRGWCQQADDASIPLACPLCHDECQDGGAREVFNTFLFRQHSTLTPISPSLCSRDYHLPPRPPHSPVRATKGGVGGGVPLTSYPSS